MRAHQLEPGLVDVLARRLNQGDRPALDRLIELVYRDLHRMAASLLHSEPEANRTRPTSLVNDLYIELQRQNVIHAGDASHFFQIAGYLMRQILVSRARKRASQKRGSGQSALPLEEERDFAPAWEIPDETVLALNAALDRLESFEPLKARIVELRYFGDLSVEQTARALDVSPATVKRHWAVARLWLYDQLRGTFA